LVLSRLHHQEAGKPRREEKEAQEEGQKRALAVDNQKFTSNRRCRWQPNDKKTRWTATEGAENLKWIFDKLYFILLL
jgi:hypothetical protein